MKRNRKFNFLTCLLAMVLLVTVAMPLGFGAVLGKYMKEFHFQTEALTKNTFTVTYYVIVGENYQEFQRFTIVDGQTFTHNYTGTDANAIVNQNGQTLQSLLPEYAVFGGWVNLMGEPISNDAQFTSDAVLRANYTIELPEEPDEPIATTHTITFLDARNNPLGGITFTEGATKDTIAKGSFPEAPNLESENMGFRYWGVYLDNEYVDWDSDSFRLEDITTDLIVRPQYEYIGQNLGIVGVDSDGDGTVDYYRVDPVRQLDKDVSIPGMIMGLPVKEIDKLYGNTSNKDQATNVITINVGEGAEIIHTGAFEATPNLTIVYLPSTITSIEERVFAINPGQEKNKKVTINYNGTQAQWEAITAAGWAQGLQSATVICTDKTGTYGKNGNGVEWT